MGTGYLADTNAIIDLFLSRLPTASVNWLDRCIGYGLISLSVVTRIELLTKTQPVDEYQLMQELITSVKILPLDEPAIQQTIHLRQQRRIKLPDAIIAATALAHGLPLITRKVADFQGIAGLRVINPHDLAQLPLA